MSRLSFDGCFAHRVETLRGRNCYITSTVETKRLNSPILTSFKIHLLIRTAHWTLSEGGAHTGLDTKKKKSEDILASLLHIGIFKHSVVQTV